MREILDYLFESASEASSLWLFDDEMVLAYRKSSYLKDMLREQLREQLTEADYALLEKYIEEIGKQDYYERRLLFNRGLSMGISLGTIAR